MENIIVALIGAGASILVAQFSIKKALQEKEIEQARILQAYEDRLNQLEKSDADKQILVDKLNSIENTVIGLKKDIEYLTKGIK